MTNFDQQLEKLSNENGFIAALDQSGGSTPKTLEIYGVGNDAWSTEQEMFTVVHKMRTRIMKSPAFSGEHILAAILFENTMDKNIDGISTAEYLWSKKNVVPILKVDKGLADVENGCQQMKSIPDLDSLLLKAKSKGIFGTKMRSVIKKPNQTAIVGVVKQQFELAKKISAAGLVPIVEPEIDIHSQEKLAIEAILKKEIQIELDKLNENEKVMLKLTLPETDNFYQNFTSHPRVLRVVALSGGYPREEANGRLSRNNGVIASFNRALTEGLTVNHSDDEFNTLLQASVENIYSASIT